MSTRRVVISHDDWVHPEFYHQTSPRKWRTFNAAENVTTNLLGSGYIPSLFYQGNHGYDLASQTSEPYSWVGRKLLPWEGESISSYVKQIRYLKYDKDNTISEYEIAKYTRPHIYRIIYVDWDNTWRSKPDITYRAGRLNLFVGPDDIIRRVGYF